MLSSFTLTLVLPREPTFFLQTRNDPEVTLLTYSNISRVSNTSRNRKENSVNYSINEASITDLCS